MAAPPVPHPQQAVIAGVTARMAAMPNPALVNFAVAAHPWTNDERWDYTRTWSVNITVNAVVWSVRGHVHYRRTRTHPPAAGGPFAVPQAYVAGPGRYWISGVNNFSDATPAWAVAQFPNITNLERTNATAHFNNTHVGANHPLR